MRRILLLVLTSVLCLPGHLYSRPSRDSGTACPKEAGSVRIVSYNVGVFSKYSDNSIGTVAQMLLDVNADAVCLNEVDSVNFRHRVDQARELADAMGGWNWHFGNSLKLRVFGGYGNAVLAHPREKVVRSCTVRLGWYLGAEPRCMSVLETERFVLGAVHLDHRSPSVRKRQLEYVTAWAMENYADCGKPVFVCGDFNDEPGSEVIRSFGQDWERLSSSDHSFPSVEPRICIDYIFRLKCSAPASVRASGTITESSYAGISKASDHLPIFVDVVF